MKIRVETDNGVVIEIDLDTKILTTALPVSGQIGEIRVEDGTPPVIHLTLPFGKVEVQP